MQPCDPARKILAQTSACVVEQCQCGIIHLTLGAITLRVHLEMIESLSQTLDEALQMLSVRARKHSQLDVFGAQRGSGGQPS